MGEWNGERINDVNDAWSRWTSRLFLSCSGGWLWQLTEVLDDPLAQEKVLVPAAQGARRALDDTGLGDGLAPLELLARQVEFDTAGQSVPPVEAVLIPVKMYFADHEITAENVMDDQGGDVTVAPGRVVGRPGNATQIAR